jgi:hypothetical protein
MISKNLARRLERLEDHLLPVTEEPLVIRVIPVSSNGEQDGSAIEFKIPAVARLPKKRWP